MYVALFPNNKKNSRNLSIGIREFLSSQGIQVVAEDADAEAIGATALSQIDPTQIKFLISMGGDGSILRIVHRYEHLDAPIVGINLGHLGFMADIPVSEVYPSLHDLINGAYKVEERITLRGETLDKETCFAVNDIVFHRGSNPSLVEFAIHVDGLYLNTFEADGVIFSTPSGSTAYSLAAGGPILSPTLEAFALTPISPHTISNRPIVLTANHEIQVQYLSNYEPIEVRADGLINYKMKTGDVFRITKHDKKFRLVSLLRQDYFTTLRSKLGWSGKLR